MRSYVHGEFATGWTREGVGNLRVGPSTETVRCCESLSTDCVPCKCIVDDDAKVGCRSKLHPNAYTEELPCSDATVLTVRL